MNLNLRAALAAFALALGCAPALAQSAFPTVGGSYVDGHALMCPNGSTGQNGLPIMVPCGGSATPVNVQGSFSASLGGFTPSASGARMTQLAVTTADSSGTLPTGAVVVVSNTGSNPMYCNVNAIAATTSDQLIAASSWFAFTIPSGVTALHCIATGGSTTADGVGGSGLPTGAGGGSGGSGGSSFTGYTPSAYATPISATTASARVAIPGSGATTVVLFNTSQSTTVFSTIGNVSVTATTAMDQIAPGGCWAYNVQSNVDVAAITASSTATVNVSAGSGWPQGCGGGTGSGGSSGNVFQANLFATGTASSAATTQQFAASGSTTIYLVNYAYQVTGGSSSDGTFQIVGGSGTNCATSQTALTPLWDFSANGGIAENEIGVLGATAAGAELCVKTTGTGTVNWRIGVVQQ